MKAKVIRLNIYKLIAAFLFSCHSISSCTSEKNYITYYNKTNKIDSIYRIANQPEKAIKLYKRLFKKYEPKNQERIEEYATYIILSDQYHENFGGKKSLYKLLPLIAPYGNSYKDLFNLYQKYGIDSIEVNQRVADWKKSLNKQLIDSFTIAMIRDQEGRPYNKVLAQKNVEKNANLLLWTFDNYGYPSNQIIGRLGNNDLFIAMPTLLSHMVRSENYPIIKNKAFEYLKLGDLSPQDYALMADTYDSHKNTASRFHYRNESQDSTQINRNRKSIGLPSLKHASKIRKDFLSKLKKQNDINPL
ncbi:hypothetical protein [Chryseobacterium oryctis]|uniref:Uncharacterized protein n=1 Tax=Chryseobacterium oryctis TaxID=2952618 RepID=A0ABT3HQW7_9FLAO|nr:hypothetical protein [Chryseobacterium oryctis]MCW3162182.1 hypothetical protein [Chryseobacterium oryctis]